MIGLKSGVEALCSGLLNTSPFEIALERIVTGIYTHISQHCLLSTIELCFVIHMFCTDLMP